MFLTHYSLTFFFLSQFQKPVCFILSHFGSVRTDSGNPNENGRLPNLLVRDPLNVTVYQGQDARLICTWENLGQYKVRFLYLGEPGPI